MPQEATKLTSGSLTLYLQNDGLRLNHSVADTQSAAILPSIRSLHMVNAVKKHEDTCHSKFSQSQWFPRPCPAYLAVERRVMTPSVVVWSSLITTWVFPVKSRPFFTQMMVGSCLASGMLMEQLNLVSWPSDSWMVPTVGLKRSCLSCSGLRLTLKT